MIERLIRTCVENRLLVVLLSVALVGFGGWAARNVAVDAIPDLSDVQVVVRADYPGQAPQVVQDQVVYPLTTALLAVPGAETVRGQAMFGSGFVYVIFEDGTDPYWARSRVLEQLSTLADRLPDAAVVTLGPDATGVGWVYQYAYETGVYCPEHAEGLWHHEEDDVWSTERTAGATLVRTLDGLSACPIDGTPLEQPDVDLAELRSLQDFYLKPELTAVDGVAEVASVGGFVRQYQVIVDPSKLLAFDLSIMDVQRAVAASNRDTGGRLLQQGDSEYVIRGLGYLGGGEDGDVRDDLEHVALRAGDNGAPVLLRDVATVVVGPDLRRVVADLDGRGETVGGIVVMRSGENASETIDRVRARLLELRPSLPPGVDLTVVYDRSDLIGRAVETLTGTLVEEIIVVSLVVLLFLLHARSALVAAVVLPTGVLAALGAMYLLGFNANIMSLGGIAISIGVMVDSSIVMVENAHRHLEERRDGTSRLQAIADAAAEVGPTLFFSLLIITASFLPIFVLGGQSGRLFKPLAYTKTFAIFGGAVLAVTLIPALMTWLVRERTVPATWPRAWRIVLTLTIVLAPAAALAIVPLATLAPWRWLLVVVWTVVAAAIVLPQRIWPEERNPTSRLLRRAYEPAFALVMRYQVATLVIAALLLASTYYPLSRLGSEFMPPLDEGDLLYMPTSDPGLSASKARDLLQQTDRLIASFPEVERVFGKAGRAETATDPAPLSMFETNVTLHRDKSLWRTTRDERFYDAWPSWLQWLPAKLLPAERPITTRELVYGFADVDGRMVQGLNDAVSIPGLTNSWTQPIRTRIDMLSTGIRTPVGVKLTGDDLPTLGRLAEEVSDALRTDPRTSSYTASAFADKTTGGRFLDVDVDREAIARYNLKVDDVLSTLAAAVGGETVTYTVEGLERYPVNVRYAADFRQDVEAIRRVLVMTPQGAQIPLGQLAEIRFSAGPPMVKSEDARLSAWVYVDVAGIDLGSYVDNAKAVVGEHLELPSGYAVRWSGQYQYLSEARARLAVAVPLALVVIVLLLYLATRSWLRVGIVLLAVPFSLVGAMWLTYLLGYELSLAVWVGVIALAGLDAETGLVMLLYLDNSFEDHKRRGLLRGPDDLWRAVHEGAVQRIRPKTMTVVTTFVGLVPLLWADGAGADTMRRLAAPMVGGLATSFVLELLIYPVLFYAAKRTTLTTPEATREE